LTSGLTTISIDRFASRTETLYYSDSDGDIVTFPLFTTSPFIYALGTATVSSTTASSGTIKIYINPNSCANIGLNLFSFTMTDSINIPVSITIQIDVVNPAPYFTLWNAANP